MVAIVQRLLTEARHVGAIRADVPVDELVTFCLHALEGAGALASKSGVRRLVRVVLDGLTLNESSPGHHSGDR